MAARPPQRRPDGLSAPRRGSGSRQLSDSRETAAGPLPATGVTGPDLDFARIPLFAPNAHGKSYGGDTEQSIKGNGEPTELLPGAVISAVPQTGVTQALTVSGVRGPTPVNCGSYEWVIQWVLAQNSAAGGHAVQHMVASYAIQDAAGKDVTVATMGQAKWDYWEAWPFHAGQKVTTFAEGGDVEDDTYEDKNMGSTKGTIAVTGDARFYEGLNVLPAGFKKNNPATQAGILASTTTDPGLTGGTASVAHNLTVTWDCTSASHPTAIVSHTP